MYFASLSMSGTASGMPRKPICKPSASVTAVTLSICPAPTTEIGSMTSTAAPIR